MILTRFISFFLFFFLLLGCSSKNNKGANDTFKPNWTKLDLSEFEYQFGDEVQFELDAQAVNGVVIDFSKDEEGRWIGICFLENYQLFGRQIPSGFSGDCIDLLDVSYLNESGVKDINRIGAYFLDINKVGIGSRSAAKSIEELNAYFRQGVIQRKKKQTDCKVSLSELDQVYECYFEISTYFK